jgi:hypothetical protein
MSGLFRESPVHFSAGKFFCHEPRLDAAFPKRPLPASASVLGFRRPGETWQKHLLAEK